MFRFSLAFALSALLAPAAVLAQNTAIPSGPMQTDNGISVQQLDRVGRMATQDIDQVRTLATQTGLLCTVTASNAAPPAVVSTTLGANVGGYFISSLAPAATGGFTITTSIAPMAYPGKVQVVLSDQGGASAPTCLYVSICGDLWNGRPACEEYNGIWSGVAQVAEAAPLLSAKSYSRLTRVRLGSCSGMDTSDALLVRQTSHIALNRRISANATAIAANDVLSVCAYDRRPTASANAAIRCVRPALLSWDTSAFANSVNILDADFRFGAGLDSCPFDNSTIIVRYRASPTGVEP